MPCIHSGLALSVSIAPAKHSSGAEQRCTDCTAMTALHCKRTIRTSCALGGKYLCIKRLYFIDRFSELLFLYITYICCMLYTLYVIYIARQMSRNPISRHYWIRSETWSLFRYFFGWRSPLGRPLISTSLDRHRRRWVSLGLTPGTKLSSRNLARADALAPCPSPAT